MYNLPVDDILGNNRIIGSFPDIGAYENVNSTAYISASHKDPVFSFFPNPASDMIIIRSEMFHIKNAEIYTLEGKPIFQEMYPADQLVIKMLDPGIYLLKCTIMDEYSQTRKLIIK
jgi:hypothetical protein